jgi:peptide/nickel transport system substrate-binding protein
MHQEKPATEWEQRIDTLMGEQSTTLGLERRREIFNEVQKVLAENAPALYFASPRLYYAHSRRLRGVVPSILRPPVLWNADSFSISSAP